MTSPQMRPARPLPALTIRRAPPTGRTGIYRIRLALTRPAKETTP